MGPINTPLIEKYKIELANNPDSLIFAPLAEIYRKFGLLEEALALLKTGIKKHPNYDLGHLILAKIFKEKGEINNALISIESVLNSQPDNMMALKLGGELYLKAKYPERALQCFKLLLFYNPADKSALNAVKKLETITAIDYDDETFQMIPMDKLSQSEPPLEKVNSVPSVQKSSMSQDFSEVSQILSLADAYILRNDPEQAYIVLAQAEKNFGTHEEITRRKLKIKQNPKQTHSASDENIEKIKKEHVNKIRENKILYLKKLKARITTNNKYA